MAALLGIAGGFAGSAINKPANGKQGQPGIAGATGVGGATGATGAEGSIIPNNQNAVAGKTCAQWDYSPTFGMWQQTNNYPTSATCSVWH